jgi:hypothetical protein
MVMGVGWLPAPSEVHHQLLGLADVELEVVLLFFILGWQVSPYATPVPVSVNVWIMW